MGRRAKTPDDNPFPAGDPHFGAWESTRDARRLEEAKAAFRRWMGDTYDLAALEIVLAVAVAGDVDFGGDPVWLLVISGSGNAKTETLLALDRRALVTSTIASEGALLSATPLGERAKDATGGLLRRLGRGGLLVIKDFTSILSMGREIRGSVLAALREVYDGRWIRNVGVDGGRTLVWTGRVGLIGATTSAYDNAHAVISKMGDRFALVRMDSGDVAIRRDGGRQALRNVGSEAAMRTDLTTAVTEVLANATPPEALTDADIDEIFPAADLVTLLRTAVERDYQGNVTDSHAPEMPTRFAKQLGQVVRGAMAIGIPRERAWQLAMRVAADTIPPLRLLVLLDVADHPGTTTTEAFKRVQKPRTTVDRTLQELQVLGVLIVAGDKQWHYTVAKKIDTDTLKKIRQAWVPPVPTDISGDVSAGGTPLPTDISGDVGGTP